MRGSVFQKGAVIIPEPQELSCTETTQLPLTIKRKAVHVGCTSFSGQADNILPGLRIWSQKKENTERICLQARHAWQR